MQTAETKPEKWSLLLPSWVPPSEKFSTLSKIGLIPETSLVEDIIITDDGYGTSLPFLTAWGWGGIGVASSGSTCLICLNTSPVKFLPVQ